MTHFALELISFPSGTASHTGARLTVATLIVGLCQATRPIFLIQIDAERRIDQRNLLTTKFLSGTTWRRRQEKVC